MVGALWLIFLHAPEEKVMGAVQKLFYFHVPAAIMTYAAVAVLLIGSIAYLWTRDVRWDNLSIAATECGLFFCGMVLITGPIWGRPAWGVWWTWEARLTTTLVLWILLAAAILVRSYADNRELGARLASVLGILAAIDIYIIRKAVEWFRGMHPTVFKPGAERDVDPAIGQAFGATSLVFILLFLLLLAVTYREAQLRDRAERLTQALGR
ncbi:hypothetical protein ABI59_02270 [Acidobacteria bacterium Mor1]|nr:hypothetical protein ABI59_02270 [Acidobacteria bacterium Mor1]